MNFLTKRRHKLGKSFFKDNPMGLHLYQWMLPYISHQKVQTKLMEALVLSPKDLKHFSKLQQSLTPSLESLYKSLSSSKKKPSHLSSKEETVVITDTQRMLRKSDNFFYSEDWQTLVLTLPNHPHIGKVFNVQASKSSVYTEMEYMQDTFKNYIKPNTQKRRKIALFQILLTIDLLHKLGIGHGNIKHP